MILDNVSTITVNRPKTVWGSVKIDNSYALWTYLTG